jgi:PIN domain nuclease of toxin-antitoxin system
MKLLIDTHLLLWAAGEPEKLSAPARAMLSKPGNKLSFSAASIWEIVIKLQLGREDFKVDPYRLRKMLVVHGYAELPITAEHALRVDSLPLLHKDPFDRLLVAQSRVEGLLLLTGDAAVAQYGEGTLSV